MSEYTPDVWVILHIKTKKHDFYKVLAGWYGGFAGSNSWKLNSGITSIEDKGEYYNVWGYSGSVYRCYKASERMSGMTSAVFSRISDMAVAEGGTCTEVRIEECIKTINDLYDF